MKPLATVGVFSMLVFAATLPAEVTVFESNTSALRWSYAPGEPTSESRDSINTSGVLLRWHDGDVLMAGDYSVPVHTFVIAVPPGTTPQLRTANVKSESRYEGMGGRPSHAPAVRELAPAEWATLLPVAEWRGYQLAKVQVCLQMGDFDRSSVLEQIDLVVTFTGNPMAEAEPGSDADIIRDIAVNGKDAVRWWKRGTRRSNLDDWQDAWPSFPLYRLGVEENGLYVVTGSWLQSRGADFIGQPSSAIKLYGNGGRPLSNLPDTATDSVLIENSILVRDGGDGVFHESDSILFYGRGVKGFSWADSTYLDLNPHDAPHQSPFARENVYFVGVDPTGTPGLRMNVIPTSGAGEVVITTEGREYRDDDAFIYAGGYEAQSGLVWYGWAINAGASLSIFVPSENLIGSDSAWVKLDMIRVGSLNNQFRVQVDDNIVLSNYYTDLPFEFAIGPGILNPGSNSFTLSNLSSAATIYVNYTELRFTRHLAAPSGTLEFYSPRNQTGVYQYSVQDLSTNAYILDITDDLHPRIASGNIIVDSAAAGAQRTYVAVQAENGGVNRIRTPIYRGAKTLGTADCPQGLRDPANRAGLVILTYDAWYDMLEPLKEFHESYREEPLPTVRVRLTEVWDEFGWGVKDVVAIRNFLEYAYENWHGPAGDQTLKYVLFVGDGDYDYRNISSSADNNWMPPWEEGQNSIDDFFVIFDQSATPQPQLYSGRWPVQNEAELEAAIEKTLAYATDPLYSPWKVTATFAADDEWKDGRCTETDHSLQSESLINNVLPRYFTFKKVYEIFFPFRAVPGGIQKPDATNELIDAINRGTLIVNYAGHGNPRIWTDEQLFVMDRDRNLLDNYRMWPLFVAATCSWGEFDRPTERCFPEVLLADPSDGAIASVGATRVTYSGQNFSFTTRFYTELFRPGLEARRSFGEALIMGKIVAENPRLYHLFGDPVLRLATPEYFARVTARDDSLQALSLFHLSGIVSQDSTGEAWSDFQGVVEARVFDTEDSSVYYWPTPSDCDVRSNNAFHYRVTANAIFRGTASIRDGHFDVVFRVPRDVRYGGTNARISLYYFGKSDSEQDSADGVGIEEHILIANEAGSEQDSIAPSITAWLEGSSFRPGDLVGSTPLLHVGVIDSSGVNLSGEVGHRITVRVDDAAPEDLTSFFNYDLDSYTTGSLEKSIGPLSSGEHRLVVEAWDSFNNLNQASLTFTVGEAGEAGYEIRDVLNYPNPMTDITYFTYSLTQHGTTKVSVKIYTLSGKLVWEADGFGTNMLYNSNSELGWDGRDRAGHQLANGVYLYKVMAENAVGDEAEATGKLVILR